MNAIRAIHPYRHEGHWVFDDETVGLWRREEFGGNWYHCPAYGADGWLCPALLKNFDEAPPRLYVRAQVKEG